MHPVNDLNLTEIEKLKKLQDYSVDSYVGERFSGLERIGIKPCFLQFFELGPLEYDDYTIAYCYDAYSFIKSLKYLNKKSSHMLIDSTMILDNQPLLDAHNNIIDKVNSKHINTILHTFNLN